MATRNLTLSWTAAPANVTGVELEVRNVSVTLATHTVFPTATSYTFSDVTVIDGEVITGVVRFLSSDGNVESSTTATITLTPPSAPTITAFTAT